MRGGGDLFLQAGAGDSAFTFAGGESCSLGPLSSAALSITSCLSECAERAGWDGGGGC